ncbi:MAG TPA: DNA translocase FtsK 4TM domain-containing protein, partial [Gemmatimonadaceae bacterium]|nr:DNA translocase FtsK 4TM domain-containing protein [Gemmatimonadaceae bacterium]
MQGVALLRGGDVTQTFGFAGRILAYPIASFLGWPAAALIPIALAAHALRLFGRLAERTDRSWMVFLLGLTGLLPVMLGLAQGGLREATSVSGLWGSFAAFYLLQFAGTAGAWIIVLLTLSALMAVTLSWNPIRAVVGRPRDAEADAHRVAETQRPSRSVLPPEPTPEEMPAMDLTLLNESEPVVEKKKKEKRTRADIAA